MREYINLVGFVFLLSFILYPFELLLPAEKGQPFLKRLLNLTYVPVFFAVVIFVLQPVANIVAGGVLIICGGALLPQFSNTNSLIVQVLFAISFAVFWDFWQYWLHRWQHSNRWLWETHRFHHSESALNATTQAGHHILHTVLAVVFYLPVLVVFSAQTPHYLALFLMFRLWAFLNHANIRLDIGPLTPIISGPQWHRIHHSISNDHHGKNFATFFPFIDKLFGTYYRQKKNEYPPSGLQGKETSALSEATIGPFLQWCRTGSARLKSR